VYRRLWGDDQVTTFLVYLAPGADAARVRSAILAGVDQRTPINVLTAGEFKRNITAAIDGAFALTYAIQLVATVIAGIGVLSFFLAEVVDRRREIGLLRTVALDRRQLLGTFTIEAALIGVVGGLLAIVWGWPVAYVIVTHSTRMLSGWQLGFTFPWLMALLTPIVVAATAACAAQLPARGIARSPLGRLVGIE
jgi:putative ABC transport system permease protein